MEGRPVRLSSRSAAGSVCASPNIRVSSKTKKTSKNEAQRVAAAHTMCQQACAASRQASDLAFLGEAGRTGERPAAPQRSRLGGLPAVCIRMNDSSVWRRMGRRGTC